jgi:exodeoxyribonuclease III
MVYIVCWNVAGWMTSITQIRRTYTTLSSYFDRLQADIVCLQEVKVGRKKLTENPQSCGACDKGNELPGWESFWSCQDVGNGKGGGQNGVTTFVRQGLTTKATATIFGDKELDAEGRCIVTYHSAFVLFNVYVPNSRHGQRSEFKARYLAALAQAMEAVRQSEKLPVILAGDLNICYRSQDCHWLHRRFDAQCVVCPDGETTGEDPPTVQCSSAVRYRLEEVLRSRQRPAASSDAEAVKDINLPRTTSITSPYCVWVEDCTKLSGLTAGEWRALSDAIGQPSHSEQDIRWMGERLATDGMVDSFLRAHPDAVYRFTVWDQYRNKRYDNVGARIDFVLVDEALAHAIVPGELPEAPTMEGALAACTCRGKHTPAPMDGSGLPGLPAQAALDRQFVPPHTGMVYTPPQYSDHVAVTCLLDVDLATVPLAADAATKAARYRPAATSVASFFTKKRERQDAMLQPQPPTPPAPLADPAPIGVGRVETIEIIDSD